MHIGMLTGGGDAPGLNAVMRAVVKYGAGQKGWRITGIEDSFNGMFDSPPRTMEMAPVTCQGMLQRGGTVLGTTNRGNPFSFPTPAGEVDRSGELAAAIRAAGMDGLLVIGGDGTQDIGWRLMQTHGIPVVGVPKTIDNDLRATEQTFGFQSAVDVATDALDRLHTTAESHDRVLFLEVMGRDAGHIALHAGISGGADVILLPEIPWRPEAVAAKIAARRARGRPFSLVIVAEGALPDDGSGAQPSAADTAARLKAGGGAAHIAMKALEGRVDAEMRICVLGHLQRGGSPVAFDRLLATRFGVAAVDLVERREWGKMVALRGGRVVSVSLADATGGIRGIDPEGELVRVARATGIELGNGCG